MRSCLRHTKQVKHFRWNTWQCRFNKKMEDGKLYPHCYHPHHHHQHPPQNHRINHRHLVAGLPDQVLRTYALPTPTALCSKSPEEKMKIKMLMLMMIVIILILIMVMVMTLMITMVMMRTSTLVAMHKSRQDMPDVKAEMVSHDPGTSLRGAAEERKYSSTRDLQTSSTRDSQPTSKKDQSTSAGIRIPEIHVYLCNMPKSSECKYPSTEDSQTPSKRVSEVWCFHFQKIHNLVR